MRGQGLSEQVLGRLKVSPFCFPPGWTDPVELFPSLLPDRVPCELSEQTAFPSRNSFYG